MLVDEWELTNISSAFTVQCFVNIRLVAILISF